MGLNKRARCYIRMDSRWASASSVCMGISVFIRAVFYFGLTNLRDLSGFEVAMDVILPMIVAAAYLIVLKGLLLNSPLLFGGMIAILGVNDLFTNSSGGAGVFGGVLLLVFAALFLATGLGYLPNRIGVVCGAAVLVLYRVFAVDLNLILPLKEFHPIAYLPEASSLFVFLAVALLAPALQLTPIRSMVNEGAAADPTQVVPTSAQAAEPDALAVEEASVAVSVQPAEEASAEMTAQTMEAEPAEAPTESISPEI